jgi:hypothetical protein
MPYRQTARKFLETRTAEHIRDQPHSHFEVHFPIVRRGDACALLTPMLQSIKTEINQIRGIGMTVNTNHPAFVMKFI